MFREAFHESNSSNPKLPSLFINMNYRIALKSVRGSMVSTISTTYAGRSGVQILDGARELSFLKNHPGEPCSQPASNSMNARSISLAVK